MQREIGIETERRLTVINFLLAFMCFSSHWDTEIFVNIINEMFYCRPYNQKPTPFSVLLPRCRTLDYTIAILLLDQCWYCEDIS